ncbi:cell division protein FtsB [Mucilaginibacter sp. PAMC 26640]|nr:cell division protein FtsB [Mucilaginibacter sp. PAMC 26640]
MKKLIDLFYTNLFLTNRLFAALAGSVVFFVFSFFFPWLGDLPGIFFWAIVLLTLVDLLMLYRLPNAVFAKRHAPERLSNSDDNELGIYIENRYSFGISVGIIDEIPVQFQKRDVWFKTTLTAGEHKLINYILRPLKRGEYVFGAIRVFACGPLGLVSRRYNFDQAETLPVYPSFLQMRKYELLAISNRLNEIGIKKIRRLGQSLEFEQIKTYVAGDDYRNINWKASARQGTLMTNSYTDEKSQQVYCIIDKSRVMKMPFEKLSLLDYAINASLVLSNVALLKEDKAGLITIAEKVGSVLPADKKHSQINKILEVLYKERTRYLETNMEALYTTIRGVIKQRSLVVFFTNYESMPALHRQLPFLKRIARFHLLLVVFFENTELKQLTETPASDVEEVYIKTIAEKFAYDKKLIVKELAKHGIQSILSTPQNLTINTINRYLELKAKQRI